MDKQSIFFSGLIAIISLAVMLIVLQYISKRQKISLGLESHINISYAIWISAILISYTFFLKITLDLIENAIEIIINSKTIENTFLAAIEKISIFIGFTFLFTFLSYLITNSILKIFLGSRKLEQEITKNNIGYFLIFGICLLLFTYSIINGFEHFLRWFMPVVTTQIYH